MRSAIIIAALATLAFAGTAPAFAQTDAPTPKTEAAASPSVDTAGNPLYVGTWADDPAQCSIAQDRENAPMVMAKDHFDQHESHCSFKSVSGHENEWKVTSECSVEGESQIYEFGMSVADKQLTMLDDAGTHLYARCE